MQMGKKQRFGLDNKKVMARYRTKVGKIAYTNALSLFFSSIFIVNSKKLITFVHY